MTCKIGKTDMGLFKALKNYRTTPDLFFPLKKVVHHNESKRRFSRKKNKDM